MPHPVVMPLNNLPDTVSSARLLDFSTHLQHHRAPGPDRIQPQDRTGPSSRTGQDPAPGPDRTQTQDRMDLALGPDKTQLQMGHGSSESMRFTFFSLHLPTDSI
ncbi:hypothetical protein J1614_010635 [Plenodomus biglobosus]|nr:hypothetical protein J1614_010635 [Plenodomus biglobosus]